MPDMDTLNLALEPPPDSWAAHIDELPKPGSHVFGAQNALALALIYASMDPDVQQQLDNLRDDVQELASQNETLDAYAKVIYEAACRSQREASKLQKQTVSLSQMVQTLAKQLEDAQTEILHANERVHGALEKRAASAAESKNLRRQLQEAIAELQSAASEREAGKMKLQQAELAKEGELDRLRTVISQLEADVKLLKDEKVAKCAELAESQNVVSSLEDANAKLVSELAVVNTAHYVLAESKGQIQSDLLAARKESHLLQEKLRHAESQHKALHDDCENLRSQGVVLEARIGAFSDERDSWAAENTALQWSLRVVQDRNIAKSHHLRDVESKRAALQTECDGLRGAYDDAQAALDKLTGERDFLTGAHSTLQGDYRDLKGENDALFLALRDAETQRKTLKAERDESVAARATLEKERSTVTAELTERQITCDALSKQVSDRESVTNALCAAQQAGAECNRQLRATEAEVERLQRELEAKCQVSQTQVALSKERDTLVCQRDALSARLDSLQAELERSRAQFKASQDESTTKIADLVSQLEGRGHTNIDLSGTLPVGQVGGWQQRVQIALAERDRALEQHDALVKARDQLQRDMKVAVENAAKRQAESRKALIAERKKVAAERDKAIAERDAISEERDKITEERKKVAAQYKKAYEGLVAEHAMRREAQQLHSNATLQLKSEEIDNKRLSSRVRELEQQLRVKEQRSHTLQLQEEVSKLKGDLAASQAAYTQTRPQAQLVEQMRYTLVQETAKAAQAQIKILDLEERLKVTKQENTKLTQKIEKLNRYLHDLRKRVDELKDVRAENERLCNQIDELENSKHKISRSA